MVDLTIPPPILHAQQKIVSASKVVSGEVVHPASIGLSHTKAEPSAALTLSAVARVANLISDFQDSLVDLRRRYLKDTRTSPAKRSPAGVVADPGEAATLSSISASAADSPAPGHDLESALRHVVSHYRSAFQQLREQSPESEPLFDHVANELGVLDGLRGDDELQALAALGVLAYEGNVPTIDTRRLENALSNITQAAVAANER